MTDTIFTNTDDDLNQTIDPNKNYLEELVGDGRKFKTPEDLARGKFESDAFIESLKREKAQLTADYLALRSQHASGAKLDELLDQLKKNQTSQVAHLPPANEDDNAKPEFDLAQVETIVAKKLQEQESLKKQRDNLSQVESKLKEHYGDTYQTVLKRQMDDLGLTKELIDDLARNHPKVLYKTLGLDGSVSPDTFQAPPRSQQRTPFTPVTNKRTWTFYEKMRKDSPTVYWDPKTQVQMHHDSQQLGEAFQDGDFGL